MKCREVMRTPVLTCRETDSVAMCARLMRDHDVGFVPIVDRWRRLVGVLTDRDLALRVLAEGVPLKSPVSSVMTGGVLVTCGADDDLAIAEARMSRGQKSRIVVVDDGQYVAGVISLSDISQVEQTLHGGRVLQAVTRRESFSHQPT